MREFRERLEYRITLERIAAAIRSQRFSAFRGEKVRASENESGSGRTFVCFPLMVNGTSGCVRAWDTDAAFLRFRLPFSSVALFSQTKAPHFELEFKRRRRNVCKLIEYMRTMCVHVKESLFPPSPPPPPPRRRLAQALKYTSPCGALIVFLHATRFVSAYLTEGRAHMPTSQRTRILLNTYSARARAHIHIYIHIYTNTA